MNKKLTKLALAAGATAEADFALFATLMNRRNMFKKLLDEMMKESTAIPELRGIVLRHDFFLQRGRFFGAQPLPKGFRRGRVKQCYSNSFKLAISREGLTYCEGFVVAEFGKDNATDIEHGWCATADGKVVDVTLRPPGLSYFGVTFSMEELAEADSVPLSDTIIVRQWQEILGQPGSDSE